jgi:Gram-negative bacterial TonB protein C-terminal
VENRVLTDYNFETVPEQETIMNRSGMAFVMVVVLFVPCSISAESEGPSIPGRQTVRIGNVSTVPNGITTAPQLLRYVAPEYTDEARRRGIDGVVTAEVEFDINGAFSVLRVIQGLDYGLTENAIAALRKWIFAPVWSAKNMLDKSWSVFLSCCRVLEAVFVMQSTKDRLHCDSMVCRNAMPLCL